MMGFIAVCVLQAGLWNVVSVPDGAPSTVRDEVDPSQDRKFTYLNNCQDMLQKPDFSAEVGALRALQLLRSPAVSGTILLCLA